MKDIELLHQQADFWFRQSDEVFASACEAFGRGDFEEHERLARQHNLIKRRHDMVKEELKSL